MKAISKISGALAAIFVSGQAYAQALLIRDAEVHTLAGADAAEVIENGDILIRDGRIVSVAENIGAPQGATVVNAAGRIATPGLIAPWSQLGLVEISLDAEANDASTQNEFPISAALDAEDGFNPSSSLIPINRAGGITRALVAPAAGAKMFGGIAMIVDLSGETDSIMRRDVAQSLAYGYQGAYRSGDSRLGAAAILRDTLEEAIAFASAPRDFVRRNVNDRHEIADLEALAPVVSGEQPLIAYADGAVDIRTLLRIKSEYGLSLIILGGSEAWRVADELADEGVPVILNPLANLPGGFEDLGARQTNAKRLYEAGVTIGFYGAASGSHNLRGLAQLAGNAVAHGLPFAAGLAGLTRNPAEMLGLGASLGTLEPGKIADVVLWDGDPLEVTSRPVAVFIEGRISRLITGRRIA